MIEDTVKVVNGAIKDKIQVNLISTTAPAATPPCSPRKSPTSYSIFLLKIQYFLFQDTGFPLFIFETLVNYTILQGILICLYLTLRWLVFF